MSFLHMKHMMHEAYEAEAPVDAIKEPKRPPSYYPGVVHKVVPVPRTCAFGPYYLLLQLLVP